MIVTMILAMTPIYSEKTILKRGEYIMLSDSGEGAISVKVNIATQMAYIYRSKTIIAITSVSTGKEGHDTPIGNFKIHGKVANYMSKAYKAPMPYTQWITNDGIALHAGTIPYGAASHGCIRLPKDFAPILFSLTNNGDSVTVYDRKPTIKLSWEI